MLNGLVGCLGLADGSGFTVTIINSIITVAPNFSGELLWSKDALCRALRELPHLILTAPWGGAVVIALWSRGR